MVPLVIHMKEMMVSRSWIDHVMCSRSFSTLVTDVFARHSGSNLSDHSPLHFLLHIQGQSILQSPLSSPSNSRSTKIRWSNISPRDLDNYHNLLSKNLPTFPPEVVNCSNVDCKVHYEAIFYSAFCVNLVVLFFSMLSLFNTFLSL